MAMNQTKISKSVLLTSLLLASLILLLLPSRLTNQFHFGFFRLFGDLLNLGSTSDITYLNTNVDLSGYVKRSEYDRLQNAYANLYADILEEHTKLEKLAQLRVGLPRPGTGLVLAEVINASMGYHHKIIINKGTDDGILPGQYVMGNNSIIGTVSENLTSGTAQITLSTDADHRMLVEIAANSENAFIRGLMQGTGKKDCAVSMISREYKISNGDAVYAAKKPGYLDTPRIIGRVIKCEPDDKNPLLWDIKVEPVYKIDELERVAVIVMNTENIN